MRQIRVSCFIISWPRWTVSSRMRQAGRTYSIRAQRTRTALHPRTNGTFLVLSGQTERRCSKIVPLGFKLQICHLEKTKTSQMNQNEFSQVADSHWNFGYFKMVEKKKDGVKVLIYKTSDISSEVMSWRGLKTLLCGSTEMTLNHRGSQRSKDLDEVGTGKERHLKNIF